MPASESRSTWPITRLVGLPLGLAVFLGLAFLDSPLRHHATHGSAPAFAAAICALMAIWWLTEAVPIYWTACLPLLLFPLFSVPSPSLVDNLIKLLRAYLDPYIFLFAGGMAIAAAMQQWDLHRRIALSIMNAIGTDGRRLLAGLLAATAFVSLWITNTATAAMMLPIGMALIAQLEAQRGGKRLSHYGMAIMLAIAYGSNVGGIGTKIGTAPNGQFAGFMERLGQPVSFLQFLAVGLPFVLILLPIVWWMLWRLGRRDDLSGTVGKDVVGAELSKLGAVKKAEKIVLVVFIATAMLWVVGRELSSTLSSRLGGVKLTAAHVEGGVAVLAAIVLFLWRTGGRRILAPRSLRTVPWETLLLLGGGFAMAAGVQDSGLSGWLGEQLRFVRDLSPFGQVVVSAVATVALSAVASNTATIAVMLVVLKDAVSPEGLTQVLFAATLASSCDFALPAGTPPNAIVFGSGYVRIPIMARLGVVLDLLAALLAAGWCWLVVRWVMG